MLYLIMSNDSLEIGLTDKQLADRYVAVANQCRGTGTVIAYEFPTYEFSKAHLAAFTRNNERACAYIERLEQGQRVYRVTIGRDGKIRRMAVDRAATVPDTEEQHALEPAEGEEFALALLCWAASGEAAIKHAQAVLQTNIERGTI